MNETPVPSKPTGRTPLADHPGFWLLLFSVSGFLLLLLSGPAIEERINRRIPPESKIETGQRAGQPAASPYSVSGLKWILATSATAGAAWTIAGLRKGSAWQSKL